MTTGLAPWRAACPRAGLALLALSCQSLLGVEELSTSGREGAPAGLEGAAGSAADLTAAPGAPGLDPGPDGTDPDEIAAAPSPAVGAGGLGDAGAPLAEDAAAPDGGAPSSGALVISGRIVDFHRRPVPDVPVSIGAQTSSSDADGRFTIAGVTPPYAVSLVLDFARDAVPARYGYVYQDLTRADPTLQVYSALPQRSVRSLDLSFDIPDYEADPERGLIFAFTSPDASFADGSLDASGVSILGGLAWSGPVSTSGNAHALLVSRPGGADGAPPVAYQAHAATALGATDATVTAVAFQMQPGALAAGTIAGAVSGDTLGARQNVVALRFADGTALPLIEQDTPGDTFSYLVPELPDTSLTVAASHGFDAPFAITWQDGIAAGQRDLALTLPRPVQLGAPQANATLAPGARFSWSRPAGAARTFLWHAEIQDDTAYQGIFVATARTELELPVLPGGFGVPPGVDAVWSVETHGDLPDVDAMTGPDGFLDAFGVPPQTHPLGPGRGGGAFTESARRVFRVGG